MTWGLDDASVVFGSHTALDHLTLPIEPSTVSVVVGGDGAGKSTLLRAIVGLVRLSHGTARRPQKQKIGYVPATAGLYVDLTVDENVAFSAGAYGLRGPDLAKRATDLLDRIGLGDARLASLASCRVACSGSSRLGWRSCTARRCSCSMSRRRGSIR